MMEDGDFLDDLFDVGGAPAVGLDCVMAGPEDAFRDIPGRGQEPFGAIGPAPAADAEFLEAMDFGLIEELTAPEPTGQPLEVGGHAANAHTAKLGGAPHSRSGCSSCGTDCSDNDEDSPCEGLPGARPNRPCADAELGSFMSAHELMRRRAPRLDSASPGADSMGAASSVYGSSSCCGSTTSSTCSSSAPSFQGKRKAGPAPVALQFKRRPAAAVPTPSMPPKPKGAALSPAELEEKREKKKERNRRLAKESRDRQKKHVQTLIEENEALKRRVRELEEELHLARTVGCPDCGSVPAEAQYGQASYSSNSSSLSVISSDDGTSVPASPDSAVARELAADEAAAAKRHDNSVLLKGAGAMALTMSMVLFTDTTPDSPVSQGSFEMIGIWAIGWGLISDSGVLSLRFIVSHILTLLFGITLTLGFVTLYYYRTLHNKKKKHRHGQSLGRHLLSRGGDSSSILPTARRPAVGSAPEHEERHRL